MNYVYMLRCADETYYIGWTTKIKNRLAEHNSGKNGAKYTRSRRPVKLVYCEAQTSKSHALKREAKLKKLTRNKKHELAKLSRKGELLTIYDANETPCGEISRDIVHALGLRHHVCHLWLIEEKNGVVGMWLQQRGKDRPLNPSMYDLSATGHIDVNETPIDAVLRECSEEIGLKFNKQDILKIGECEQSYKRSDGGFDDELVHCFAVRVDSEPQFNVGSEVQRMIWVSFDEFLKLENGAQKIKTSVGFINREDICCVGKGEWKNFEKHLSLMQKTVDNQL